VWENSVGASLSGPEQLPDYVGAKNSVGASLSGPEQCPNGVGAQLPDDF
jgi:hypothetical protein